MKGGCGSLIVCLYVSAYKNMGLFSDIFSSVHHSAKKTIQKRIDHKEAIKEMGKENELYTMCGNCSPLDFSMISVRNLHDHSFLTQEEKQTLHSHVDFVLFSGVSSVPSIRATLAEIPDGVPCFCCGKDVRQYVALGIPQLDAASLPRFVLADIDRLDPLLSAEVVVANRIPPTQDDIQKVYRNHSSALFIPGGLPATRILQNHSAVYTLGDGIRKVTQKSN